MKPQKTKITIKDYIKANRKGIRDASLENATGFKSTTKVHKSNKTYKRIKKNWSQETDTND